MPEGLVIRNLTVGNEKTTILNDVSLVLGSGKSVGLVGPSGSGKTMLARSILGLLPNPIHGFPVKLNWMGAACLHVVNRSDDRFEAAESGIWFNIPHLRWTQPRQIRSQIASTLISHGMDPSRRPVWKEVRYWLTRVGFRDPDNVLNRYPFQLSGGMARRVYLAMLFLLEPDYLIVDEPTSGLDVTTSRALMQILFGMRERCTLLMITHDVRLLAGQVNRLAVMYNGQIVDEGTMDELFRRPGHEITELLLRPLCTERLV